MIIRRYKSEDCKEMMELYYNTVHTINAQDYSKEQLDVWATGNSDIKKWNQSFLEHTTFVAEIDGSIVGFGDIDHTGYLDFLYVHKEYQRQGIASHLCDALEQSVETHIITHASITAKGFFEQRGYHVIKKQQVERNGIYLTNYVMSHNI